MASKKGKEVLVKVMQKALLKSGKRMRRNKKIGQGLDTVGGQITGEGAQKFLQKKIERNKRKKSFKKKQDYCKRPDPVVSAPVTEQNTKYGEKSPASPGSGGGTVPSKGTRKQSSH